MKTSTPTHDAVLLALRKCVRLLSSVTYVKEENDTDALLVEATTAIAKAMSELHEDTCTCPDCLADRPEDFRQCNICKAHVFWDYALPCANDAGELEHHICRPCDEKDFR